MQRRLSGIFGLLGFLISGVVLFAQDKVFWVDRFPLTEKGKTVPSGWTLDKKVGNPEIRVEEEEGRTYVRFFADKASFGLRKELSLDIKEYPYLHWRWKVTRLPEKGDFTQKATDDQAAQVYVLFPRFPAKVNTEIVGYLWESQGKNKGKEGPSPAWSKSKVIVLQAGPEKLNQWVTEKRNVYEDYKRLFQKDPPKVGAVSIYINTQHTQGLGESCFGEIYFSKE